MSRDLRGSNDLNKIHRRIQHSSGSLLLGNLSAKLTSKDNDRQVKHRNSSLDLEHHNRTVKDQNAVNSGRVMLVDHSHTINYWRAAVSSDVVDPIPSEAELQVRYYLMKFRGAIEELTIRINFEIISKALWFRCSHATHLGN
ncbi:hypothetical protein QAD02_021422 [Eretmocerus hayati]|uniref:Uncharacterized protein n=1 Tax=Eretmocerus hayati TaxID=131215 RepID=A0ACC2PPW0_9HYME|nr:hypothetical protein QAD02_021422 [Eretmocerus hayati]